jgi:hypothetical protein
MYYRLSFSVEKDIIGTEYPQIQNTSGILFDESEHSIKKVLPYQEFSGSPVLNHFELHKSAKLTDVLSNSMLGHGLLMNNRLKTLLQDFNVQAHYYFQALVKKKSNQEQYSDYGWLVFNNSLGHLLDYRKSTFSLIKLGGEVVKDKLTFEGRAEFEVLKGGLLWNQWIKGEELILHPEFNFDLFNIGVGSVKTYVSERLYQAILNQEITGVNLKQANELGVAGGGN